MKVENLCKRYGGETVLQDVTFSIGPGVTCLMAPSGAGKTTLLRILLGLETADSGVLTGWDGLRVSAVFQEDRLLEQVDAWGNLQFVQGAAFDRTAADALLAQLGLTGVESKPVRAYSGGMKRRLALARALSVPFDLLILDEPFTGLDDDSRQRCIDCIRECSMGRTVLLVTHNAADAAGLDAAVVTL